MNAFCSCAFALSVMLIASPEALGQCCLGAQDISAESINGRFRVEANSLNGKSHHGPYHYRFTTYERNAEGTFIKLDSFDKKWEDRSHFTMDIMVSPLGNGFAVKFPSPTLAFFRSSPPGLSRWEHD